MQSRADSLGAALKKLKGRGKRIRTAKKNLKLALADFAGFFRGNTGSIVLSDSVLSEKLFRKLKRAVNKALRASGRQRRVEKRKALKTLAKFANTLSV